MDTDKLPDLPQEIIIKILSHLPVKSLLRFKCVHKLWLSLFSDPQFIKTHHNLSLKSQTLILGTLILGFLKYELKCFSLQSLFYEPRVNDAIKIGFSGRFLEVLGSCNGLLCVATKSGIHIWNPSTRESKTLPPIVSCLYYSGWENKHGHDEFAALGFGFFPAFGFGYDNSTDDYKLVFFENASYEFGYGTRATHIYSLKANSWRRTQTYDGYFVRDPVCINGVLHWEATPFLGILRYSTKRIDSFDLAKETYEEIPQPSYGEGSWQWNMGVLEGCLCVVANNGGNGDDVWVMKEYGVKESWTKLFAIPYTDNHDLSLRVGTPLPLSVSENGDIVFEVGIDLVLYSRKDNSFKHSKVPDFIAIHHRHTFAESLISPNAYNKTAAMGEIDEGQGS